MKTNIITYLIIAFFTVVPGAWAQDAGLSGINIGDPAAVKQRDRLSVSFNIALDGLKVKSNDMLALTPVLKSNENSLDSITLAPVVVAGRQRYKVLQRKQVLGAQLPVDGEPMAVVARKNNTAQTVPYTISVPYRQWMQDASLSMVYRVSGCADCEKETTLSPLLSHIVPKDYVPAYRLTYFEPSEAGIARSDRHTAAFNFEVDRYELLGDYKDNAAKFREVEQVVADIQLRPDTEIVEFRIMGYASPEATVEHNRQLAENRANAFADYLMRQYGIERSRFTVESYGEDWQGLRKSVLASSLADKQAVLDIIDKVQPPDARDAELQKLSGGKTYDTLLNDYYPPLRRTEYVVAYRGNSTYIDEARMVNFINAAAIEVERGNTQKGIEQMLTIENDPRVWNNLGVAYARKGDTARAKDYFTKAAGQDNADAVHNLGELDKVGE